MLSMTPIRAKNVSFQLPGSTQRATTPQAATAHSWKSPPPNTRDKQPSPLSKLAPTVTRISSPQPDLIADILDQSEETQAKAKPKKEETWNVKDSQSNHQDAGKTSATKEAAVVEDEKAASKTKQDKRVVSGQCKAMKSKWSRGNRSTISTTMRPLTTAAGSTTGGGKRTSQIGQVTRMALQIRDQTNVACLDHTRWMKHDVAKLREHVIKIEEEIRLGNKAKATLDAHIFDLRKCLSVNQQSISAQQKKTHREVHRSANFTRGNRV